MTNPCRLERGPAEAAQMYAYKDLGRQIEHAYRLLIDHPVWPGPTEFDGLLSEMHETHMLLRELDEGLATSADKVTVEHTPALRRAIGVHDLEGGDA